MQRTLTVRLEKTVFPVELSAHGRYIDAMGYQIAREAIERFGEAQE